MEVRVVHEYHNCHWYDQQGLSEKKEQPDDDDHSTVKGTTVKRFLEQALFLITDTNIIAGRLTMC